MTSDDANVFRESEATEDDEPVVDEGEIIDAEVVPNDLSEPEDESALVVEEAPDESSSAMAIDEELAEILADDDPVARERDEYFDALLRLQAEFENYRKRMTRQQSESLGRATEALLERLLPTLDALDLALAHSSGEEGSPDRQALTQIASLLRDTLGKEGLERIDSTEVEFDPTIHDAVMHLEREEGEQSTGAVVSEVMRAGYLLKGKVVRPAMVQVRG